MRYTTGSTLYKLTGFLVIALFVCALQFFTPRVYGQPLPCNPGGIDCSNWTIDNRDYAITSCGNNCYINVLFAYRTCDNGRVQDLQILGIYVKPGSTCQCYDLSGNLISDPLSKQNLDWLQYWAFNQLIVDNPMNFLPNTPNGGCYTTWRGIQGACIKGAVMVRPDGTWVGYEFCAGGPCCSAMFMVCRSNGIVVVTRLSNVIVPSYACMTISPIAHIDTEQCFYNCDWLFNTPVSLPPEQPSDVKDEKNSNENKTEKVLVRLYALDGSLIQEFNCLPFQENISKYVAEDNGVPLGMYLFAFSFNGIYEGGKVLKLQDKK